MKNLTMQWAVKHRLPVALFVVSLLIALTLSQWGAISEQAEALVAMAENRYQKWFEQQPVTAPFVLLPLAFFGGLLSSFSPCILPMLPINLSYIGTLKIASRWDALLKASLFVLGAVTALSVFGLFSAFTTALFVDYRGPINILVGLFILIMGLGMAGLFRLPLPQISPSVQYLGPFGVGLTFTLVTSPCASPILFSVLAAGAGTGSQVLSTLAMASFALGYTALIFFASLFTGLAVQARRWTARTGWLPRFSSALLMVVGLYYVFSGVRWYL